MDELDFINSVNIDAVNNVRVPNLQRAIAVIFLHSLNTGVIGIIVVDGFRCADINSKVAVALFFKDKAFAAVIGSARSANLAEYTAFVFF